MNVYLCVSVCKRESVYVRVSKFFFSICSFFLGGGLLLYSKARF